MNLSAIFSKTGKGVQEASGKTSHLSRADRAVLSAIDGKTALSEVQKHFEKLAGPKFEALIQQLDRDGFIREVSSGATTAPSARPSAPPPRAAPPPSSAGSDDDMDFTQAIKLPPRGPAAAPKAPPVDLAAAGRAEAERKAKEAQALDYKARQEAETKAKAEAELKARAAQEARLKAEAESKARAEAEAKAREAAEAKGRADAEAKARAEAETKARADADSKTRAEAEAKVKAAREAAVRMATEAKARAEADAKAKTDAAERDKARLETELNAKLDAERKAREDAERRAAEAAETTRRELEEKSKRDAEELRQKLEAEMKAKLDAERKVREEEDRKRREEEDRRRKEEDERRAKEDAERRAREEADRKKREEEDRKKREEEDRKRREDDERRRREDDERRAKEDAERKAREEEDRKRRKEEDERRAKEDAERRALEDTNRRLETDRRAKEDAERKAKDDAERRAKEEAEAKARAAAATTLPKIEAAVPPPPPPPPPPAAPAGGDLGDSLLADLDSFGKREEEEQKEKEEAERKAKEEAAKRAKAEAERKAKEEAEKKRREEEERGRKEEEERRAKEEAERKEREEEARRKEEEAERKRKAKEALAAKQAEERAAKATAGAKAGKGAAKAAASDDDIGVTDDDLDTDDLKHDQKVAAEKARKAVREQPAVVVAAGRPKKWGRPAAIALFVLLIAGVGVLQVMPLSTAEYEKAASDAMGVPVKISSARLSVITGIEVKLEGVSIGDAVKIRVVHGSPEVGSLVGARKSFSRVELEGVSMAQSQIAGALLGKVGGDNFRIARITAKQLTLDGPLKLPPMDLDATVAGDGSLQTVKLAGPDKLSVTLLPKAGEIAFDISAGSLAPPFVPALNLSEFAMKGTANSTGIISSEFDGRLFDGVLKGSARVRWGANWSVEGELRATGLKVAVFAPTLVSDGRVDGRAAYSMAGSAPATLYESARLQGEFKIEKGVIGSFDLSRALQTGGTQTGGRTVFNELTGQGLYDKGTVQISNASLSAGAMNAGLSLNIDAGGGLSGRVVADVKTANQSVRATLNISGKVQDPVIRK